MRNDAHDELDHVPSLRPDIRDDDDFDPDAADPLERGYGRGAVRAARPAKAAKGASTGPLWALVGALTIALGGLGWWSFQQISLMEQQLVATQESFARISEEAAGRIQDITGKVVATESSVTTGSEALKLQVKQLESKLAELSRQQQGVAGQQGEQAKRLDQLAADLKAQKSDAALLDTRLKGLAGEQEKLQAAQADLKAAQGDTQSAKQELARLDTRLKGLAADLETLKKQGNPNQAIGRLEQDLLVLRSEMETRAGSGQGSAAEFDAFRAQMTRNITSLQSQLQSLQQQINAR